MAEGASGYSRRAYLGTLAMLALALAFPIALMVLNPTLMFERGWEQYLGTSIYLWAVITLSRELVRLWGNEKAFAEAPGLLAMWTKAVESPGPGRAETPNADESDQRLLPTRLRQL